jgi:serine/threonine protein kinase
MPPVADDVLLCDALEAALQELLARGALDLAEWQARYPAAAEELPGLLQTLRDLHAAAAAWRSDAEPETTPPATSPGEPAPRRLPSHLPERIGRYRIVEQIGAGGMGVVYRAHDEQLQREVAVKVPHFDPHHPDAEVARQRFLREARLAAGVRHSHICPIHDVGEQAGTPYVVLEFLEGGTLADRLRRAPRFEDCRAAVALVRQVAEGLEAVHAHGILHRDLKPGNILLDAQGNAVLTDFGLARPVADTEQLTQNGVLVGTPAFMAPEQAAGQTERVGPRSDLYSLGVVLYVMLTGRTPFTGSAFTLLHKITHESPPRPSSLRPDLDPSLEAILLRAMAADPEGRYPSARAFASALGDWLAAAGTPTVTLPAGHPLSPRPGTPRARPGRGWRRWALAAVLLLGGGLAATMAWNLLPSGPSTPSAGEGDRDPGLRVEKPLHGELLVRVWSEERRGVKKGLLIEAPGALPVRNGEMVHLEARADQPAYLYLLWVTSGGTVQALYPWNPAEGFKSARSEKAVREVHTPPELNRGWEVEGTEGLETAILLARPTPLPREVDLETEIGSLRPALNVSPTEMAWLELTPGQSRATQTRALNRGLNVQKSKEIDEPILKLLEQLRPHFELMKAVRFAHQE